MRHLVGRLEDKRRVGSADRKHEARGHKVVVFPS